MVSVKAEGDGHWQSSCPAWKVTNTSGNAERCILSLELEGNSDPVPINPQCQHSTPKLQPVTIIGRIISLCGLWQMDHLVVQILANMRQQNAKMCAMRNSPSFCANTMVIDWTLDQHKCTTPWWLFGSHGSTLHHSWTRLCLGTRGSFLVLQKLQLRTPPFNLFQLFLSLRFQFFGVTLQLCFS